MYYLGIDPGTTHKESLSGVYCLRHKDNRNDVIYQLSNKKNRAEARKFLLTWQPLIIQACLEEISSNFRTPYSAYIRECERLEALQIKYESVEPKVWQKEILGQFAGDKILKGKTVRKMGSLHWLRNCHKHHASVVGDNDNKADAYALTYMAENLWRQHGNI